MRASIFALTFAMIIALPATGFADDISDCNSDKPDAVIQGCSNLIKSGKVNNDAMIVALFNRGNAYDDSGSHDEAIADYTAAIKLRPDYTDAYFNRGLAYVSIKDYDSAIADFSMAVKLDPKYARAYYNRAAAYEAKGDLNNALDNFEAAARFAPNSKTVQDKINEIKQKLGQ